MQRVAFKMKLLPGQEIEYRKRHDEIWPELADLLREAGIRNYSIFLDEETSELIGFQNVDDNHSTLDLPGHPIMKLWWAYMADIMETLPDHAPVTRPLKEVFYLP